MYLGYKVKIPTDGGKITVKKVSGRSYLYIEQSRSYSREKKYTIPKRTCIGRQDEEEKNFMYPNEKFLKFFPGEALPAGKNSRTRSGCLHAGAFMVIQKVISDYKLDEMIARITGRDAGLFLDLSAYSIITEDHDGQYYPDYACKHPLFAGDMKVCSDFEVSDFLKGVTTAQRIQFLNEWNAGRDHREIIYISYDSANKKSQAGDIELVEPGYPMEGIEEEIFGYATAYDRYNREPLFYASYPGSIVGLSQLRQMLKKAKSFGYEQVCFILDKGYFCRENIGFMDEAGYDFVIMLNGMKSPVSELILEVQGSFENDRRSSIRSYRVSGTTVKRKWHAADKKERYFHIYYDDRKKASDSEKLKGKIDRMGRKLRELRGESIRPGGEYKKYFDLLFRQEGPEGEKLLEGIEKTEVINREIRLCGYFVLVTSAEMTAAEALNLYKSRDESEKTFRADKSYLGDSCGSAYLDEPADAKIFIGFVASVIRSKIYTVLKDKAAGMEQKSGYMTVPAAIKELEKIELRRGADSEYILDGPATEAQKTILKAFDLNPDAVQKQAGALSL